jgi:hypothetical protein
MPKPDDGVGVEAETCSCVLSRKGICLSVKLCQLIQNWYSWFEIRKRIGI